MEEARFKKYDQIYGAIRQELPDDEKYDLENWLNETESNRHLFNEITKRENIINGLKGFEDAHKEVEILKQKMLEAYFKDVVPMAPSQYRSRYKWLKLITIAASMLIVISTILYLMVNQNNKNNEEQVITGTRYNTLSTAKGETYQVILPDGSKVWLNAVSSIHYPMTFTGNERRVDVIGEAYFEVKKDDSHPFKVSMSTGVIEVLGTHFNINSYSDEPASKTTLLEGSVKVMAGNEQVMIKPGQQAIISSATTPGVNSTTNAINVVSDVDISQAVAWKDGDFDFNNSNLKAVMRQITRWYDLEVVYPEVIPDEKFWGKIPRKTTAAEIMILLEKQSRLQFKIEGKKIIIKLK